MAISQTGLILGAIATYRMQVEKSLRDSNKQLAYNAAHDKLTGLPNRYLFIERLHRAFDSSRSDSVFAVLFLDLDRFKVINDSMGHLVGDQLLIAIVGRLKACLRPVDTIARFGGDEFIILLENLSDVSDTIGIAERIQTELRLPFNLNEQEVFITVSIGIALSATGYSQPEDMLRDADIAMYRAKNQAPARYEIFNTRMHQKAVVRLQMETDLRRAIERQEFLMYYQPIVSLETGRIIGFESLLRWQHPQRGLVSPTKFIPIAEETELICCIDKWVMGESIRQMQHWQQIQSVPLSISVNVCHKQFIQPNLVEQISQIIQETSFDANHLKLEITEKVMMEQSATTKLTQLKALGIRLAIDDFGTGYSSLSRLHSFPIDELKIDRSFVRKINTEQGKQITETIITLSQKLRVDVTAEGIETAQQLAQIRNLKCQYGQGYFFSPPLPSQSAEALIVANPQW
ncbi:EAL domain-containing protein [Iningainema sp. BLCCT55]|uniref:EAL domain-containing protein n=2 Tax=Iningainema TaxID=1932705 RepID=A0A8J6XHG1_9CYAN|nr:EAL domain-containing protein [Iningainema tapete BLCC-T55]